jgi:hypothetical protein
MLQYLICGTVSSRNASLILLLGTGIAQLVQKLGYGLNIRRILVPFLCFVLFRLCVRFLLVLSVLPPSDNSIAVRKNNDDDDNDDDNNNNNNNNYFCPAEGPCRF